MQKLTVNEKEEGQRLDKYLKRKLPEAPMSFFYKMLRKKNITLNGKKADGREAVQAGDLVTLFLADETIEKFRGETASSPERGEQIRALIAASDRIRGVTVLYEDENILICTKPFGVLSQGSGCTAGFLPGIPAFGLQSSGPQYHGADRMRGIPAGQQDHDGTDPDPETAEILPDGRGRPPDRQRYDPGLADQRSCLEYGPFFRPEESGSGLCGDRLEEPFDQWKQKPDRGGAPDRTVPSAAGPVRLYGTSDHGRPQIRNCAGA